MAYDIQDALDWFDEALARDQHNRDDYETNQRYLAGDQWSEDDRRKRGEGAIVVNKLDTPVVLVVNQVAQSLPGPQVSRRDAPDTEACAQVYEGILRDIEYTSGAGDRYLRQLDYATGGNLGILRLYVDYVAHDSNDQELRIGDVADPMMCVFDPDAQEPDKSDMKRLILRQPISCEEYEQRFGKDPEDTRSSFAGNTDQANIWFDMPKDTLWIAEDWKLEFETKKLLRVNGRDFFEDDQRAMFRASIESGGMVHVESSRTVHVPKIVQRLIDGVDVLEENDWPGRRIPFFPVVGTERYCRGKRIRKSIVSDARVPQKLYNYVSSQEMLDFRNAPASKFMIGTAALAGHEDQYRDLTDPDVTLLTYNEYDEQGRQLAPPVFQRFAVDINNYIAAKQQFENDLQQLTRTPASALGESQYANESGSKIRQLQQQSGLANSHAGRGLKLAVQALYREAITVIPTIYSQPQAIRIIGADQKKEVVWINQHMLDGLERRKDKNGKVNLYNLSAGRYDVIADVGPSYQSQQQETAERTLEMAKVVPQLSQLAPDVLLKLQNLGPLADEAIDRVTPPQYKEQAGQQDPQADRQRMIQLDQAAQAMHQEIQRLTDIIKTEQIKAANDYKKAELVAITQLRVAEMNVDAKTAIAQMQAQINSISEDLKFAKELRLQHETQAHQVGMAAMEHAHALGQTLQQHDHAVVQQDQQHENTLDQQQNAADLAPEPQNNAGTTPSAE